MKDRFSEAEERGRNKYKKDLDNSPYLMLYKFTEDKFNPIDCYVTVITSGDNHYAVEIKYRDIPITSYSASGLILEVIKKNALIDAWELSGYVPYYVNYFQDGRIVWDLRKIKDLDDRIITKSCTKTTAENYGNRVDKKVILLYPNEGNVRLYN